MDGTAYGPTTGADALVGLALIVLRSTAVLTPLLPPNPRGHVGVKSGGATKSQPVP